MTQVTDQSALEIFTLFQDETRLSIYLCLSVYSTLTVKELSQYLHKGKTTINHHLKILSEAHIVQWTEKKDDKKQLKTRYFSINSGLIKDVFNLSIQRERSNIGTKFIESQALMTNNLIDWLMKYISDPQNIVRLSMDEFRLNSLIQRVDLTSETLKIYQKGEKQLLNEIVEAKNLTNEDSPTTHISTHILIPIEDILKWRKGQKER